METNRTKWQEERDKEIDLFEIAGLLWSNLGRIILAGLAVGILALLITIVVIRPTYQSKFSVYVNNRNAGGTADTLGSSDVMASQSLAKTYAKIISSRPVVEDAMEKSKLNKSYDYDKLQEHITTSTDQDTQLVEVSVVMRSPEDAFSLADAIAQVAPDYVADVVEGSSMKVVAKPVLPTKQYKPSPKKNTAIGLIVGILLMAAYIIIQHLMDNRVKSDQELEERYGISIIGTIPNFFVSNDKSSYGGYYAHAAKKRG